MLHNLSGKRNRVQLVACIHTIGALHSSCFAELGRWTVPRQRYSHAERMRAVIDATDRIQIVLEVSVTQVTL
jgi:hypothetical protein